MRDVALSGLDSCLFQRQVIETTLEPHPELTTHVECIIYNIASLIHRLAAWLRVSYEQNLMFLNTARLSLLLSCTVECGLFF